MRKSFAFFLFVAFAALLPALAKADIIAPVGLAVGAQYQLIFVTADTTTATSGNINTYNAFVQSEAALNPLLPSTTWDAIGSTLTVNANVNAPNLSAGGSYLPVYNTQGIEVSGAAGLYAGRLSNPVLYNQYAIAVNGDAWTGSNSAGLGEFQLGRGGVSLGITNQTGPAWLMNQFSPQTFPEHVYGLSTPITVNAATAGGGPTTVGGAGATFNNVTTPGSFSSTFYEPASNAALIAQIGNTAFHQINFALPGSPWQLWDLGFSGAQTGGATVTLHFDPSLIGNTPLANLYVEHYENGAWVIPSNQVVDTVNDTITFDTDGFSPFMLAATPEPSSVVLMGFGAVALAVTARRRMRMRCT